MEYWAAFTAQSTAAIVGESVLAAVVLLVAAIWWKLETELNKPPPSGGTPYSLKNGMTIQHWQASETDFLYEEIWGKESAYKHPALAYRKGATIIDAGANIGMFTLYAANQCRGVARIISFEPIPSTHAVLAANAAVAASGTYEEAWGLKPGATALQMSPLNLGLSDAAASVTFQHHPHFSVWSTSDAGFAEERLHRIASDMPRALATHPSALVRAIPSWLVYRVARAVLWRKVGVTTPVQARLVTLSSQIEKYGLDQIDLLKIDVEGAEVAALQGIAPAHWPRIKQLVMEVENFNRVDEITDLLEARGFHVASIPSERIRNPGVLSEVSMLYAVRESYAREQGVWGNWQPSYAREYDVLAPAAEAPVSGGSDAAEEEDEEVQVVAKPKKGKGKGAAGKR